MIPPLSAILQGQVANPTSEETQKKSQFLEKATVTGITADGKIYVNLQGRIIALQPISDDSAQYKVGVNVWVAKDGNVKIIQGVVRG